MGQQANDGCHRVVKESDHLYLLDNKHLRTLMRAFKKSANRVIILDHEGCIDRSVEADG